MHGILPAAVTPLDEAGRFVPAVFEQLLERLYGAGVHGIYVCGSTGFADAVSTLLVDLGVPADQIRVERFGATG